MNAIFFIKNSLNQIEVKFIEGTVIEDIFNIFSNLDNTASNFTLINKEVLFLKTCVYPLHLFVNKYVVISGVTIHFLASRSVSNLEYILEKSINLYEYCFKIKNFLVEYDENTPISLLNTEYITLVPIPSGVNKIAIDMNFPLNSTNSSLNKLYNTLKDTGQVVSFYYGETPEGLKVFNLNLDEDKPLDLLDTYKFLNTYLLSEYALQPYVFNKSFSNLTKNEFERFIKNNFDLKKYTLNIIDLFNKLNFYVTYRSIYAK